MAMAIARAIAITAALGPGRGGGGVRGALLVLVLSIEPFSQTPPPKLTAPTPPPPRVQQTLPVRTVFFLGHNYSLDTGGGGVTVGPGSDVCPCATVCRRASVCPRRTICPGANTSQGAGTIDYTQSLSSLDDDCIAGGSKTPTPAPQAGQGDARAPGRRCDEKPEPSGPGGGTALLFVCFETPCL